MDQGTSQSTSAERKLRKDAGWTAGDESAATSPRRDDDEQLPLVAMVLKAPSAFARQVAEDRFELRGSLILLATAAAFHAVYGLAIGVFSGGDAVWSAAIKTPLILLATLSLCAPSLYVLLGLSGSGATARQTLALLSGAACLSSLLMLGFAPVAWLFGVSTGSLHFIVLLHVAAWCVSIGYGLRLLGKSIPGNQAIYALGLWVALFLLVSAQMFTYFRPLVAPPPAGSFRAEEKKFFFQHFVETMQTGTGRAQSSTYGN